MTSKDNVLLWIGSHLVSFHTSIVLDIVVLHTSANLLSVGIATYWELTLENGLFDIIGELVGYCRDTITA